MSGLLDVEVAKQLVQCNIWRTGSFQTLLKSILQSVPAFTFNEYTTDLTLQKRADLIGKNIQLALTVRPDYIIMDLKNCGDLFSDVNETVEWLLKNGLNVNGYEGLELLEKHFQFIVDFVGNHLGPLSILTSSLAL